MEKFENPNKGSQAKQEKNKFLAKLAKWSRIATLVAATFLPVGVVVYEHEKDVEYDQHVESFLSQSQKERLEVLSKEVGNSVGKDYLEKIIAGDKAAFFERKNNKPEKPITAEGFESLGLDQSQISGILNGNLFPKNWIIGEIDEVKYVSGFWDKMGQEFGPKGVMANFHKSEGAKGNTMVFFDKDFNESLSDLKGKKEDTLSYIKYLIGHESAHANDWETDRQSSILERLELISAVIHRMESRDAFRSVGSILHKEREYYDSKENIIGKAQEYWAEICKVYFEAPLFLKGVCPKDYKLVDDFVRKQDPLFDALKNADSIFFNKEGNPNWVSKDIL